MFAGIKRLFGLEKILDNNDEDICGKTKRPEWEREDGTIDKEQQEEALKEMKLLRGQRKQQSKKVKHTHRNVL